MSHDEIELEGIAVIGMAGRFPGAATVEAFWYSIRNGVEAVTFFTDEELLAAGIDPEVLQSPGYVKASPVLDDIAGFDTALFEFSAGEARLLDPQHRFFLECAWTALEDAGYPPLAGPRSIGVFGSVSDSGYLFHNLFQNHSALETGRYGVNISIVHTTMANDKDYLATRVSHRLNLTGPAVTIQTACSSSLVATHMACQSLLNGECDVALAGGASIKIPHISGYFYDEGAMVSPDGHCRAFDAQAQGTVFGSGVGVIVLKPLAAALADGDNIYAVIKGSAINNDGSKKLSYSAPSVDAQADVILEAQAVAGVTADTITYIEAHGTGTPLGDPIEIAALTQAFHASTRARGFCAIGSVKTNIGHLEAASGITGLIKAVLSLKHRELPPSLHFQRINPKIDIENSPFYVNAALQEWHTNGIPRRAGVSSLGVGGTNAHVVLEEAPERELSDTSRSHHLILLSARTAAALERATGNLADYLAQHPAVSLADVAYTLQIGRTVLPYRRMLVCHDQDDAVAALTNLDPKRVLTQVQEQTTRHVTFMFSGQGAQYINMAQQLYADEPLFRAEIDRCAELLRPHLGLDLREVLYPAQLAAEEAAQRLKQTAMAQPALFAIEYACAKLWMAWGVRPQAMIGHSIGEYVAACLAGVFSLEDALALVAARGRLMQQMPIGTMLSVPLPEQEVLPLLNGQISLAAVNEATSCVVSGPAEAITDLEEKLNGEGLVCRGLHTSHAFHSAMMDPMLEAFTREVQKVQLQPPRIPYISNVSGTWITGAEATNPAYWARHLRQTVRFADGMKTLLESSDAVLLEVGPGHALSTFARRHPTKTSQHLVVSSIRHAQDQGSDTAFLLTALGQLWLAGVSINWADFYAEEQRCRVSLPTYPFEHQRCWIEPRHMRVDAPGIKPGKQSNKDTWFYMPTWKQSPLHLGALLKDNANWLVFGSETGFAARLVERLRQSSQSVITVLAGTHFSQVDAQRYTVSPTNPDDYNALFKQIQVEHPAMHTILHLWSITPDETSNEELDQCEQTRHADFASLLAFVKALTQQELPEGLQVRVISNNMQTVAGESVFAPEKATLSGLCIALPQEYPGVCCQSIDLNLPEPGSWQEQRLLNQLAAELSAEPAERFVAYRGQRRWIQTFEQLTIGGQSTMSLAPLRERGAYLLIGGLDGVSGLLAEYLAQTVQASLVIIEQDTLPERAAWNDWLATHEVENPVSRRLRVIQACEAHGTPMLLFAADAINQQILKQVITQAEQQVGPLNGVFYARYLADDTHTGPLATLDPQTCVQHLTHVIGELSALQTLCSGYQLDLCMVHSSLAAVVGRPGQTLLTTTHCLVNALVQHQYQTTPTLWMSVNWDAWQFVESDPTQPAIPTILPAESTAVFERLMTFSSSPHVIVSTEHLPTRIARSVTHSEAAELEEAPYDIEMQPRPDLQSPYVAPTGTLEHSLANIWQLLLGIEQIGIHDNFFSLGGDSVIGVRVAAMANEVGIRLSPKQLFEHQTIAELAAVVSTATTVQADQGPVTGPIPLTAIQHWFFEQNLPDPDSWSIPILLEARQPLDASRLEQALQHLLLHHDALRLRYACTAAHWSQTNAAPGETITVTRFDLSHLSAPAQHTEIEATEDRLTAQLSLTEGPLIQVALFYCGQHIPDRLLIVLHHMVWDIASERILCEDSQTVYRQLERNEPVTLPPKTTSFKHWAEQLTRYAQSAAIKQEATRWLDQARTPFAPIPLDYPGDVSDITETSWNVVMHALTIEETSALFHDVQQTHRIQINEVLLTALLQTLNRWTGEHTLLLELEGQGREVAFPETDLSRTVGWFTTVFPMMLHMEQGSSQDQMLKSIKEQLRSVANEGLGYGVLRYMGDDPVLAEQLRAQPHPQVFFYYLGHQAVADLDMFSYAPELIGRTRTMRGSVHALIEIRVVIASGQLQVLWSYSDQLHNQSTIQQLATNFLEDLRAIIRYCQTAEAGGLTPSDFPDAELNQSELDDILAEFSGLAE